MPEFLFGFTCANPDNACNAVKELMGDEFRKIINTPKNRNYDHAGILIANNIVDALLLKKQLENKAKDNLISIEITTR